MKRVKYTGDGRAIGRFGYVAPKTILNLTEAEYDCVKDDGNYKLLDGKYSDDEIAIARKIKPLGTHSFDLRTIPWEEHNLSRKLTARFSRGKLLKIIDAIVELGGVIDKADMHSQRIFIVDSIIAASRLMGWDMISYAERMALPVYDTSAKEQGLAEDIDTDPKPPTSPVDAGKVAKKKVVRRRKTVA